MNYRLASILPSEAANTAGTKTIDINVADPISRFVIQMKGLNSADAPVAHPAKMISKIELVDGSDVLFSLSGVEAQALNFYDEGKVPHTVLNYLNDVYAIATFHIDFGRFLYDPVLAFDPKKLRIHSLKSHTILRPAVQLQMLRYCLCMRTFSMKRLSRRLVSLCLRNNTAIRS